MGEIIRKKNLFIYAFFSWVRPLKGLFTFCDFCCFRCASYSVLPLTNVLNDVLYIYYYLIFNIQCGAGQLCITP